MELFFNKQFYHDKIEFRQADERFSQMDKAAVNWLHKVSGKEDIMETLSWSHEIVRELRSTVLLQRWKRELHLAEGR